MGHVTCRVPDALSEQYERGAEERGAFESEIVRRALRYYVEENPDEIRAFTAASGRTRGSSSASGRGGREAVDEARVDPGEVVGEQTSETADTAGTGVYDPTEDA